MRTSLFLCCNSGSSCRSDVTRLTPPLLRTASAFARSEAGSSSPDVSSIAAGKLRLDKVLIEKKLHVRIFNRLIITASLPVQHLSGLSQLSHFRLHERLSLRLVSRHGVVNRLRNDSGKQILTFRRRGKGERRRLGESRSTDRIHLMGSRNQVAVDDVVVLFGLGQLSTDPIQNILGMDIIILIKFIRKLFLFDLLQVGRSFLLSSQRR